MASKPAKNFNGASKAKMRFSSKVRFLPWVGDQYASGLPWGGPVLIVGESHYGDDRENRSLTRDVIERQWNGESYAYFTKLAMTMTGNGVIDKREFWHNVAFYNFVQDIVADTARVAPSEAMWKDALNILPGVLEVLAPRYIVVTGSRLWSQLPGWPPTDPIRFEQRAWEVCADRTRKGGPFLATYLLHPSSPAFGASKRWHRLVKSLLRRSNLAGDLHSAT